MTAGPDRKLTAARLLRAASIVGILAWSADALVLCTWGRGWFLDLRVYLAAGHAFLHGAPVYTAAFTSQHLPFSYPPVALVVLTPLSLLPVRLVEVLWWFGEATTLTAALVIGLRTFSVLTRRDRWGLALAIGGISSLALEPVRSGIDYGQINFFLMALVVSDLLAKKSRWRGIPVGLAAAIKLTPLFFVLYFAFVVRDRKAAGRAIATFAGLSALVWACAPVASSRYFFHDVFDPNRFGGQGSVGNQSLSGVFHRSPFTIPAVSTGLWLGVGLVITVIVVWLATRMVKTSPLQAVFVMALGELLVSPISWSHHWCWLVFLPLVVWPYRKDVGTLVLSGLMLADAVVAPYWLFRHGASRSVASAILVTLVTLLIAWWLYLSYKGQRVQPPTDAAAVEVSGSSPFAHPSAPRPRKSGRYMRSQQSASRGLLLGRPWDGPVATWRRREGTLSLTADSHRLPWPTAESIPPRPRNMSMNTPTSHLVRGLRYRLLTLLTPGLVGIVVVAGLGIVQPGTAGAVGATLYAAPGATGNCSSTSSPCGLQTALDDAVAGDSVDLLSGTFSGSFTDPISLTIEPAPSATDPVLSGGGPILLVQAAAVTTLEGVTVTGGSSFSGAGILNDGTLIVDNATISDNGNVDADNPAGDCPTPANGTPPGSGDSREGAGIYNNGSLTLENSVVTANDVCGKGGGIFSAGGTTTALENSTVSGNGASAGGCGIYDLGTLSVTDSMVTSNQALTQGGAYVYETGGGIESLGSLTMLNSTVSDNTVSSVGAGFDSQGPATIEDSTISGNVAKGTSLGGGGAGGGLSNGATLTIEDSTIADNSATGSVGEGGGVWSYGPLVVEASTISDNAAVTAGGIDVAGSTATLAATLVATAGGPPEGGECGGTVTDAGYNIDDDGSCGFTSADNSDSDSPAIDDFLGSLNNFGGPTETVPLLSTPSTATSDADPALAVIPGTFDLPGGSAACSDNDQRGDPRQKPCDVGAFELAWTVLSPTITGISPVQGPVAGGTQVTISGTGLTGATAVTFGGAAAVITSDTATQIVATTPPGSAGATAVTVTTSGSTTTDAGAFTYYVPGLLRVTTSPALPSQITVDGTIADTWGLTWAKEAPGAHTVCFSAVQGYTTPSCQSITVSAGATTTVTGTFVERGYLHVTTSPAVDAEITYEASPSTTPVPMDNYGAWTDLPVGAYSVCFGAVAGYSPPACQAVTLSAGATTAVTGDYTAWASATGPSGVGLLRVTTSPALPSQITVDGTIADTWGLNWLQLAPGTHSVCFSAVQGYSTPACQSVTVTANATTTVTGTFVQRGFLQVETSPALAATISINGLPADDWGVYTDLPVGTYSVCFGAVSGDATPACQSPSVTAGATTTITGTY